MDKYDKVINLSRKHEQSSREATKRENKLRLTENVKRRFTTAIIGALDSIQKELGYLWADSVPYNELSEREAKFRDLWIDLRKEILDKGHAQSRAAIADIDNYDTSLKYKYTFDITDKELTGE